MTQPFPNPNITGTVELIEYANIVTGGWVTPLFMATAAVALFIIMQTKNYKVSDSLVICTFIPFVLGAFLWTVGLLQGRYITFFLAAFMMAFIYSLLDRK